MYHLAGLGSRKSSLAPASLVFLTECSMCFSVRRSGRYSPRKTRQSFGHLLSDFCSVHGSCFIHVHAISCQGLSYAMLDPHRSKGPIPIPLNGFSHGPSAVVLPPFFFFSDHVGKSSWHLSAQHDHRTQQEENGLGGSLLFGGGDLLLTLDHCSAINHPTSSLLRNATIRFLTL